MSFDIQSMYRFVVAAAALLAPLSGWAQSSSGAPEPPKVARGIVTAIDNGLLTLKSTDGKTQTLMLAQHWSVSLLKPVAVETIQPGSFIGTAEMPLANGSGRSLEVHVFPPGVKAGEGHFDWDLRKGSKMTNGTVGKVTAGAQGRELQVEYPGGQRHVVVPQNVPVVQITNGDRSQVKPGVPVFVMMTTGPTGQLTATGIAVSADGTKPPM